MKLTQKNADALKLPPKKRDYIQWDENMKGFGLRLRDDGPKLRKSWCIQYRIHGRSRRMTIGRLDVLDANQAREAAKAKLAEVALGRDPAAAGDEERSRAAQTMSVIVDEYLRMKESKLRVGSYRITKGYLTGYHFKSLHSTAIAAIGRADIARCLNQIILDKRHVTASRARAHLSAFFTWAMRQGYCDANPVIATENPGPAKERDRVLSDAELAAIWNECGDDDFGKIVKLLMLTGCRRDEIGGLRWSEIAPDRTSFTLPAERVKNNHAHTLPLLELARDIIDSVPQRVDRDCLFGTYSANGFAGWHKVKKAFDARLGDAVGGKWRLHDLRRTFVTRLCDIGIEPHVVEQAVNHRSGHKGGVAGIYNRARYEKQIRAALARWEDYLQSTIVETDRRILSFPTAAASDCLR
jgi:integrase